jgi:hypothetical protein
MYQYMIKTVRRIIFANKLLMMMMMFHLYQYMYSVGWAARRYCTIVHGTYARTYRYVNTIVTTVHTHHGYAGRRVAELF